MPTRRIQNPGIEVNEIDRSKYNNKVDYSLPNSPTILMTGFASKGDDLTLQWINSKETLDDTYGAPTNEFEKYFYNGVCEVLNRGATCIASKLPYTNESTDKFNYIEYSVSLSNTYELTNDMGVSTNYKTIEQFRDALSTTIQWFKDNKGLTGDYDLRTINLMSQALEILIDTYPSDGYSQVGIENLTQEQTYIRTIRSLYEDLSSFVENYSGTTHMFSIYANDPSLTSYIDIVNKPSFISSDISSYGSSSSIEELDGYLTDSVRVAKDTIRIYDITRSQFSKYDGTTNSYVSTASDSHSNDFLGIVPIIVTPANALFFQSMIDFTKGDATNPKFFNQAFGFTSIFNNRVDNTNLSSIDSSLVLPIASIKDDNGVDDTSRYKTMWSQQESLSKQAVDTFPIINYDNENHYAKDNLKKIGVVVFKAFKDVDNNNKVNFQLIESFIGSLDQTARDQITNSSIYIDNVVNSQSQYIRMFSNIDKEKTTNASLISMSCQKAVSLGFYSIDCKKIISYSSMQQALDKIFKLASNPYTLPLDVVIDAGVSNIAQIAKAFSTQTNVSQIDVDDKPYVADYPFQLDIVNSDVSGWKSTLKKFDNFVKYSRKDCMFIADGLRPFCLDGNSKIVRPTAPNNTVATNIIPKLKFMTNAIDSSYSAGYCNWYYQQDYSSDDFMWIPPSIKAAGVFAYCDTYFQPWSAPAGITRATLNDVVDVAFVPNEDEAGRIYNAKWNYAMSYPMYGIVIEGHKTFQAQRTALDRINVRRLMLYLEKKVARASRQFVYEDNTAYLRNLFVDTITPIFEDAVRRNGVKEYAIKCDDELNTVETIENNELRCRIAVKPVKCVDFIVIDMISTRQSANVSEEVLS